MRKQFKTIAAAGMAAIMAGTTVMPAFANSTSVKVGVVASATDVITYSVTVPTTLAMAVVADQASGKEALAPEVMMGSSVTGGKNSMDAGSAELEFKNESKKGNAYVAVNISQAAIKTQGAAWKLKDAVTVDADNAHAMQFALGSKPVKQVAGTNTYVADFSGAPIQLGANATQTVDVVATAGGCNSAYTKNEDSATAYTIEWKIGA